MSNEQKQELITVERAAEVLQCTVDRVHDFCDQGLIHRKHEMGIAYVSANDVTDVSLIGMVGEVRPGELIRKVIRLERKVERLQAAVSAMFLANGAASAPYVPMEDGELFSLYDAVEAALSAQEVVEDGYKLFCDAFIRITETEIERLNEYLQVKDAWLPLLNLCSKLMQLLVKHPDLPISEELRTFYVKLEMGKKNLMTIAIFFIEHGKLLTPQRRLLNKLVLQEMDTFDSLAQTFKKRGGLSLTNRKPKTPLSKK